MSTSTGTPAASSTVYPELVLSVKDHLLANGCIDGQQHGGEESLKCKKIRLILASQSPRRKEILDMMGLKNLYEIIPSPANETEIQNQLRRVAFNSFDLPIDSDKVIDPAVYACSLAVEKATAVARDLPLNDSGRPHLIIGSDTIVVMKNDSSNAASTILEKPKDSKDAIEMLRRIQGQWHTVFTGVAIIQFLPNESVMASRIQVAESFVESAHVNICRMSETDIERYVATGEPMDKAGAYGIQGIGGQIVSSIHGDFFAVMGLPMHQTSRALASAILAIVHGRHSGDRA